MSTIWCPSRLCSKSSICFVISCTCRYMSMFGCFYSSCSLGRPSCSQNLAMIGAITPSGTGYYLSSSKMCSIVWSNSLIVSLFLRVTKAWMIASRISGFPLSVSTMSWPGPKRMKLFMMLQFLAMMMLFKQIMLFKANQNYGIQFHAITFA